MSGSYYRYSVKIDVELRVVDVKIRIIAITKTIVAKTASFNLFEKFWNTGMVLVVIGSLTRLREKFAAGTVAGFFKALL